MRDTDPASPGETLVLEDPRDDDEWCGVLGDAARALRRPPGRALAFRIVGAPVDAGPPVPTDPCRLAAAALALASARDHRRSSLAVRASGRLAGPLLALAVSADFLLLEDGADGFAGTLLAWQDRPLPLPGDLPVVSERLGRRRALELASGPAARSRLQGAELVAVGLASTGPEGLEEWERAGAASGAARAAAAMLLGRRRTARSAAEALERTAFALCFASPDRDEGVAAFLEKRPPDFQTSRPRTATSPSGPTTPSKDPA